MVGLHSIPASKFFALWAPLAVASAAANGTALQPVSLSIAVAPGVSVPAVSAVLGALGIVLSRPLAHKSEARNGVMSFMLVSAIMLIVVEVWIAESRPSWLFSFVIAIGLGFSGYSLIELVGSELREFVDDVLSKAGLVLRLLSAKLKGPK